MSKRTNTREPKVPSSDATPSKAKRKRNTPKRRIAPLPWIAWIGVAGAPHSSEDAAARGAPSRAAVNPASRHETARKSEARVHKVPPPAGA